LGRAIAHEPQVFLIDEPLSNLDAALNLRTAHSWGTAGSSQATPWCGCGEQHISSPRSGHRIAA
jgi:hypothetical protein